MKREELKQLHELLLRLDVESKSVPEDLLLPLAQACGAGASMMWAEREERMEGTTDYVPDPS